MKKYLVSLAIICSVALLSAASYSDDFNRSNENPIAGNWATPGGVDPMQISSNQAEASTAGANYNYSYYNNTFGNDQDSQGTLKGTSLASFHSGVGVRGSTSALTGYFYGDIAGTYKILLLSAGSSSTLATCTGTPTAGHVMKLSVTSNHLTGTINGGSSCTVDDSTLTSGKAFIFGYSTLGQAALDDWSGSDSGGGGSSNPIKLCNSFGLICH